MLDRWLVLNHQHTSSFAYSCISTHFLTFSTKSTCSLPSLLFLLLPWLLSLLLVPRLRLTLSPLTTAAGTEP
jgi:hypothetical protein